MLILMQFPLNKLQTLAQTRVEPQLTASRGHTASLIDAS